MDIDNDSHYRNILRLWIGLGLLIGLLLDVGCSNPDRADDRPTVIATTTILGDVLSNIAGDEIELEVMIPRGVDPHDFSPSAQEVASISSADLLIANGLGLEEGLIDILEQARSEGIAVLELAPELDPLPTDKGGFDPHFWQDPERMVTATALIASALINNAGLDPQTTSQSAAGYGLEIEGATIEAENLLSAVPGNRRKLVTNHDAFGYFAARYNFEIIGIVIPGGSTLGEPSSAELAALVAAMVENDVRAIFVENIGDPRLATTLAAEIGREIAVVHLVSDALGEPGSETGTYIDMILFNARAIATALAPEYFQP